MANDVPRSGGHILRSPVGLHRNHFAGTVEFKDVDNLDLHAAGAATEREGCRIAGAAHWAGEFQFDANIKGPLVEFDNASDARTLHRRMALGIEEAAVIVESHCRERGWL